MAALNGQRTFLEMQGDVAALMGDGFSFTTSSYPTLTQAKQIINRFYKRFVSSRDWKWMQKQTTLSTVAGVSTITMPDDVEEIVTLRIANLGVTLRPYSREQFLQEFPNGWTNTGSAIPQLYVQSAPAANNAIQIDVWPMPSAIYTVSMDYKARFTPLSGDSDYSVVPPEAEDYLVYASAAEMLLMQGDQRNEAYKAQAAEVKNNAWKRDEEELSGSNGLRGVPFGGTANPQIYPYRSF